LIAFHFSFAQSPKQEPEQTHKANSNSYTSKQGTERWPFIVKPASPTTEEETNHQAYERHTKPKYERRVMIATVWLAVITTILAILNFILWLTTKKTAKAALKTAQALPTIERAYVFVTHVGYPDYPLTGETEIVIRLRNEGKTPAVVTQICADFFPGKDCPKQIDKIHSIYIRKGTVIGAGMPYDETILFPSIYKLRPIERHAGNARTLDDLPDEIVYGTVEYEDIFKESHMVRFCWHQPIRGNGTFHRCDNRSVNYYT
jgi:hypothetical protein